MEGKFKKKIEAKTDALLSEVSRKKMAIDRQKSVLEQPGNCHKAMASLPEQNINQ